ncbi:MAG: hypothetical protein ACREOO_04640 [bacterium]
MLCSPRVIAVTSDHGKWLLDLPKGTHQVEVIVLHGVLPAGSLERVLDLQAEQRRAIQFLQKEAHLPQGRIHVPDGGIRNLLEASIRNMYQIREAVDGRLQFQPGPSVYRGLWMHDLVYTVEAAALLGDLEGARIVLENVLQLQRPDGQIQVMPPSFTDGGIHGVNAEYSSVYWSLIAIHQAIETATWLGRATEAQQWQTFFDDFMSSFRRAYARDKRQDAHGHWYLPMRVADTSRTEVPQRGQWAPLEAVFRGGFLDAKDELVTGTLAILDDSLKQGITVNTGWLKNGVWPFFDALRGLAHLWCGHRDQAVDVLYAFANHASSLGTWVEEQHPQDVGNRTAGDASNASASAFYSVLLRHLLVSERENQMELCAGVPADWLAPNSKIELDHVPTELGPLTLRVHVADDGRTASILVLPLHSSKPSNKIVLMLQAFKQKGYVTKDGRTLPDVMRLDSNREFRIELKRDNI